MEDLGRWIHADPVGVTSEQTTFIITEIEEKENKHSILGDDTREGEYEDISNSDRM